MLQVFIAINFIITRLKTLHFSYGVFLKGRDLGLWVELSARIEESGQGQWAGRPVSRCDLRM